MPDWFTLNQKHIPGAAQGTVATKVTEKAKKTGQGRNKGKKHKQMKQKQTYMPSGSRSSPEGTRLPFLVAGGAVSPADGQQKDENNVGTEERQPRRGHREREPKQTVDHNEVAGLYACCFGWSGVISHYISRYILICLISYDIRRYNIPRYHIHIPIFEDWFRDIVSHRNISRYRTLVNNSATQAGKWYFFLFLLILTFQVLGKLWSQASSLPPAGTCLQFLSRIPFSVPIARRFSSKFECCSLTLSRFPRVYLYARKRPYELLWVCTRGDSNSRNWPIAGTRIMCYTTGATGITMHTDQIMECINNRSQTPTIDRRRWCQTLLFCAA